MLKNYIIEKELGKGTYGVVYKAKKKDDNNIYVIKQISLLGLTKDQKNEVKQESEILKKIKSKYVVKYYDSFEEDNKLNIVMEYCESGDLSQFIENQKKTSVLLHEDVIWKFFIKITLGLADIHKIKILHRDLKSLNIFLKQEKDVRVGDLGVAKVLNQTFFAKTFIGTPYYLSPEICEDKPYNDKSDVWALGCILYELCTYHHPFTARSQGGLILKILNENPKPINDYYSKDLRHLIKVIFDKDYQKRPSCLDILKMNFVIEKAKSLGIFEDIKNSFPDIESSAANDKIKINKNNNKLGIHIKPIIVTSSKGNSNSNNKKRPASGYGVFGRKNYNNLKFNNIGISGVKKKNDEVLIVPNNQNKKKKPFLPKKVRIVPSKDNVNKSNNKNNKVRKKVIVSPKQALYKAAEKFEKKFNIHNIKDNNDNNNKPIQLKKLENENNWINTNELNKIANDKSTLINRTDNDNNNKNDNKNDNENDKKNDNNNANKNDNNNDNKNDNKNKDTIQKGTVNTKFNYSIDSKHNIEINDKDINIDFEKTKEKNDNNNFSIESDIYMTAKRDQYQPQNKEKKEDDGKGEEKKMDNGPNNFPIEGSLPLMQTKEFNDLLSDFDTKKDATINDFRIIDNNNEVNKNEKLNNIDNNNSISSDEEEKDDNKYFSDNDNKSNEEDEDRDEEEEKVTEIGGNNDNAQENVTDFNNDNNEEEKANLKRDLKILKDIIDGLKEELPKLIGDEKYKYVMEIVSNGVKDSQQEEVNEKIEKFIKENTKNDNEEQLYNIFKLFILEDQYYKKQELLKKL